MVVRSDKRGGVRVVLRIDLEDVRVFRCGDVVRVIDLRGAERVGVIGEVNFNSFDLVMNGLVLCMSFKYVDWIGVYEESA